MLSLHMNHTNIDHDAQLPIEIFTTIISFLDNATLAKIKRVNKTWRVVINKILRQRKTPSQKNLSFFGKVEEEVSYIIGLNLLFNPKNSYPDFLLRLLCFGLACIIGLANLYIANKYIDKMTDKKMEQLLLSAVMSIVALGATYAYAIKKAPLPLRVLLFWTEIYCAITITRLYIPFYNRKLEPKNRVTIPVRNVLVNTSKLNQIA